MDVEQVNQIVGETHFGTYRQARLEGKSKEDALRIAEIAARDKWIESKQDRKLELQMRPV